MGEWVQATVSARHDWAEGLMTLKFAELSPSFVPGQFFNLALEIDGKRVRRAYSAASGPDQALELVISRVENGALTPSLFDLRPGHKVWVDQSPAGFFTLGFLPAGVEQLWLIATGTGVGPYVSMLRAGALDAFGHVVVVHGVRRTDQLTYPREWEIFGRQQGRSYLPVVTGQNESCASGLTSRIPILVESGALEQAADLELNVARSHVLLCGNPDMIRETTAALEAKGLKRHRRREPGHITTEKYW